MPKGKKGYSKKQMKIARIAPPRNKITAADFAGLRKKKVRVQNVPARLNERQTEFTNSSLALDDKLNEILKEGGHLVFLDECLFKSRDFARSAWSNSKQNLEVYDRT